MPCAEIGECFQGRARCKTPITCSGAPVEQAIEHFRTLRQARPPVAHKPAAYVPVVPEGPYSKPRRSLLASRAFWIGGALSLYVWAELFRLFA